MRTAGLTTVRFFSGIGLIFASALAASEVRAGGALYRWETADGTVAYTDDAKRVPERYRDSVQTIDRTMLMDYGRYTPTDAAASQEYADRLAKRLEGLRAMSAADDAARADEDAVGEDAPVVAVAAPATRDINRRRRFFRTDGTSYYRYYRNQTTDSTVSGGLSLPVDPNDPNPVVTEQQRVKVPGEPVTQTITVTRQGDRILSVVKPRTHYHGVDFPELSEFE